MILNQLVIMLAVDKTLSEAMLSRTLITEMYWMPLRESRYHDSMTFRNITGRGQMKKKHRAIWIYVLENQKFFELKKKIKKNLNMFKMSIE